MLLQVPDVLASKQAQEFIKMLNEANWVEGKMSVAGQSTLVKKPSVLAENSKELKILGDQILAALEESPRFVQAALPLKVLPPFFTSHSDNQETEVTVGTSISQVAGTPFKIRADISATLFLSDPLDYDGGELILEDSYGTHKIKLPAGQMILYPASAIHCVTPVTKGNRIVASFSIESMIRDTAQRNLIFDFKNLSKF